MDAITAWSTAVAASAAVIAAFVAIRSLRVTQRAVLLNQYLMCCDEMLAALAQISSGAHEFERLRQPDARPHGYRGSRQDLAPAFHRFTVASSRADIIEPTITRKAEYGEWVRSAASNLAVNLLQADEFATPQPRDEASLANWKPASCNEQDWANAINSRSYQAVLYLSQDLPSPRKTISGFVEPECWWRGKVVAESGGPPLVGGVVDSVYSSHATYFTQTTRLLDDFVREYLVVWVRSVVDDAM